MGKRDRENQIERHEGRKDMEIKMGELVRLKKERSGRDTDRGKERQRISDRKR